jgi:CubicO group peptidase (beta-lactamase class C family)
MTPHIPTVSPGRVGFVSDRLDRAYALLQRWSESGEVPASALCVGRRGAMVQSRYIGVPAGTPFLVASLTKPVVAAATVLLIERGELGLDDRVSEYVPEFAQEGKQDVRIRHLLTHTSGLPDMLPENEQLRASHAPLSAFVEGTCRHPLLFPPGTRVRYQSKGFLMLGEIIGRVSGVPVAEFLRREFFEPLGMADTALGAPREWLDRIAPCLLEEGRQPSDWDWNSPYWRMLGAPWGGLITTPEDFARFSRMVLDEGSLGRVRILSPAAVRAMTSNQLPGFPDLPEEDRRCRPWGLGWRLCWPGISAHFGDLLGPRAAGHWGATGTLFWIDPDADAFCILLTNRPCGDEGRHLARVSSIVAGAMA